ncbi:MAG: class I SAM-dependent methyltransferase [Solirubrobacterales bacterium]
MSDRGDPWDRAASSYDRQLGLERRPIEGALDLLAPTPDERLLDLATGTGAVLRLLAQRPGRPTRAVGIDRSREMLDRVPELPPKWRVDEGEAHDLPFADNAFDIVTCSYLLHVIDDATRDRTLSEIRRVLCPGARVVTVTPTVPRGWLGLPYRGLVAGLERVSATAGGLRPLDPLGDLEAAGLEPVRGRYVTGGYPSLCVLARVAGR